jgi:hypothetical protein
MLKGSNSLESEFRKLADSHSSNIGKIYESFFNVILAKRPEKKKDLQVEKKPKSLGVKAEKKSAKDLGLRIEHKAKPKVIERKANDVGVLPKASPSNLASASLVAQLLYEYSNGKSRVMMSPQDAEAVLTLTDKSTKEGDVIANGADLKVSAGNGKVLFETDSKGVVIYSQNQRDSSVLKKHGLDSAMKSLRIDLSNVISKTEAKKPLGKDVEELNQSAVSLDNELLSKSEPIAVPVKKDLDIPKITTEAVRNEALAPVPAVQKSTVPPPVVTNTVVVPPKALGDQEKIRLLNNPELGLEPGSSVKMKGGGNLSVEQHEGTLVVFFSDGERAAEQIASVENGMTKISPQFSEQVASMLQEHISELPQQTERASPSREAPEIDDLEQEEEYEY